MKIQTASGEIAYNAEKVKRDFLRAFDTSENVCPANVLLELEQQVYKSLTTLSATHDLITKEQVLDTMEDVLMSNKYYIVARTFIRYRFQHILQKDVLSPSGVIKVVNKYIDKSDWRIKENANMAFSLQGLNNSIITEVTEKYWLDVVYPKAAAEAHRNGRIYIHDLGLLANYCCGWDIQELLMRGFGGVSGKTTSGPAKHFSVILGQLTNFLYTLQGEIAGAVAVSSLDTYLAPFIAKDGLCYNEVKQLMQEFIYNMNVPTRVGFQSPFSNITLDLKVPKHMQLQPVIIGGEMQKETYGQFQKEMDWFNKAFFEIMLKGDYQGRIFTFPIPTLNIGKDFDWDNPVHDIIWEATAKMGIPYFANFINSDMSPEDARSMCCRLRIDNRELRSRGGGLFGANPLTGSIGVCTLNLPMMAYEANGSMDKFYTLVAGAMEIAKEALEAKRKMLEALTERGLFPYSKVYLDTVYKRHKAFWANHFSTIGLIGMYESARMLGIPYESEEGKKFGVSVLTFMREKILHFQEETGNMYNLEATPAEGASYKLALITKAMYPKVFTSGEKDIYFTNSSMLPVGYTDNLFKLLEHQNALQPLYTGGSVTHIFLGERLSAPQAKLLIKKVLTTYRIPYISLTPTFSVCPKHGYLSGEHSVCPKCLEEKRVLENKIAKLKENDNEK